VPAAPNEQAIAAKHRKAALSGIGLFARQARGQAKAAANEAAQAELAALREKNRILHDQWQAELDDLWQRLLDNDPDVVLGTLAEAFEDNDAAAAPVGVEAGEASIVVLVPNTSAVPERRPTTTNAGNLSLKKLTKREVSDYYKLLVCGYVLTTMREAFAVAPGLRSQRIVAVRNTGPDAYGRVHAEAILAARFSRESMRGVQWDVADAATIVNDTSDELQVRFVSTSQELAALSLTAEPDLAAVVAAVDLDDLQGPGDPIDNAGSFEVILVNPGDRKILVIKLVREAVPSMGLKEAKDFVESTPSSLAKHVSGAQAQAIKAKLELAGAEVIVVGIP
jgi:ribosomal protein L7/L12